MDLLSHYRNPRHKAPIDGGAAKNPLCGDEVTVGVELVDGRIASARFDGVGCLYVLGGADRLCEHWVGMRLEEAQAMGLAEVLPVLGVDVSPSREACAMLPVKALAALPRPKT